MGTYEYMSLPMDERANILWDQGLHLATVEDAVLYSLDGFYVEVTVKDGIQDITAFKQGERLDKYLNKIKL